MSDKKIALVQGGMGAEREVSLSTGKAFAQALTDLNYNYVVIDAKEDLPVRLFEEKPSVALLALHGKYAEDGVVQGICEYLKIPYTGSGVLASSLCMNKIFCKQILIQNKIPTSPFQVLRKSQIDLVVQQIELKLPFVVKPSREGSSVGVHICKDSSQVSAAVEDAFLYDSEILIEKFLDGKELTVAVVDGKAMTPIEIEPKTDFYNYENKYTAGKTEYHLPARIEEAKLSELKSLAEQIYRQFNIRSYCRVDFMSNSKGDLFCLEINTLPGCTPTSLVPKAARHDGLEFSALIQKLVESATLDYAGVK
ncbi:MAG: D-alanine--D-alanine ligase [Bdellovibrionales bacterium]